ncbi:MAG TPA: c-type cytochrome [Casimicrobiaceae bacterium]|nr:c-type cytochrome [Casimicrobiaceae bacterium]
MFSSADRARAKRVVGIVSVLALAAIATLAAGHSTAPRFGFGNAPTRAQVAAWDIDVRPDGTGLPEGRGTVEAGQRIYDAQCASCHGTFGESNDYMEIAGGIGTLASDAPKRTTGSKLNHATTLWDYINRAMPFGAPKTLTADEVFAVTAYVLHLNGILPADAALDRKSIVALRMPNHDGFTTSHGLASKSGRPDTGNVACMRDCGPPAKVVSEIPGYARDAHGKLADQFRSLGRAGAGRSIEVAARPMSAVAHADLAKSAGCTACHGVTQRLVGPAFREIGGRYAGSADAAEKLVARLREGGGGQWGAIPMPPQPQLSDGDARTLVDWILAGAK